MASFSNLSHAKLLTGTLFSILVFVGDLSHKTKILWTICNCLDDHLLPVLRAGPFAYSIYMLSSNFPPIPVNICLGQDFKIELLNISFSWKSSNPMLVSCLGVLQHYFHLRVCPETFFPFMTYSPCFPNQCRLNQTSPCPHSKIWGSLISPPLLMPFLLYLFL